MYINNNQTKTAVQMLFSHSFVLVLSLRNMLICFMIRIT